MAVISFMMGLSLDGVELHAASTADISSSALVPAGGFVWREEVTT
jgi:hypothetical protein